MEPVQENEITDENSLPASHLRQPSRIPSPGKGLFEISASTNNARAASSMPQPAGKALKHKGSALPEPAPKRKTLAERAGEVVRPNLAAPPSSRPISSSVRATTMAGMRNASFSSSVSSASSRQTSSSRNISGSSYSSSVGSGTRAPLSSSTSRPQTSMGVRHTARQPTGQGRPASVLEGPVANGERPALGKRKAWDTKGRLEDVEFYYAELVEKFNDTTNDRNGLEETLNLYKTRINELEAIRSELTVSNGKLQAEVEVSKSRVTELTSTLETERRSFRAETDDLRRQHRDDLDTAKRDARDEIDRLLKQHREELADLERRLKIEIEEERSRAQRQVQELTTTASLGRQQVEMELDLKDRELRTLKNDLEQTQGDLEREKALNGNLRGNLSDASSNTLTLESSLRALKARIDYLESDSKAQSNCFADLQQQLQDAIDAEKVAKDKLRHEETLRRKLHNQVQELKGNIRVFCRIRPTLHADDAFDQARITLPDSDKDSKEVVIQGPEEKSSLGTVTTKTHPFAFDRVFGPSSQNAEVFEEISQLVQSALDGYNVCIFCYGQTGSGKTFTMSSEDGMIPRAVHQIYDTAKSLEEKGWKYSMEGSFVEVYNENLNDLLGKADDLDKKKHEIRHDPAKCRTTITDITTVNLDSPSMVESILRRASSNRSVAATKANERSSRSHSVFILRLIGENSVTGEKSEGTLNLVDLAGSERLSHSGATGERLKETQNINKSLSCLGDVIGALGQGKEGCHIPYRNSKLTYLLQYSLGGNSKTLMFVMVSPLQNHLSETLTSLKFATKVHNTHIGTAKKQTKVRDG